MLKRYKQFFLGFLIASLIFCSITVFADTTEIKAFLSDIKIALNGQVLELKDTNGNKISPIAYNGITYLPVKVLANVFGKEVNYDSVANIVNITEKVIAKPEPETEAVIEPIKKEPINETDFLTVTIDGKKYITIGQFSDTYYDSGYRLQNIGSGYFRFFHMYNGVQTDLIPKVKILIKDNEYYIDYDFLKNKMEPLIEVAETTPPAKPIEKEPAKDENKDITLKVSESFEKDGFKLTLKKITKSNTVFTFHFYYENNTDKPITRYSGILADSSNPKFQGHGGLFMYADTGSAVIGGFPANSKDEIFMRIVDFEGLDYIRIKDTNVKWQIR